MEKMHPDFYVPLLQQLEEYRPCRIPQHNLFSPTMSFLASPGETPSHPMATKASAAAWSDMQPEIFDPTPVPAAETCFRCLIMVFFIELGQWVPCNLRWKPWKKRSASHVNQKTTPRNVYRSIQMGKIWFNTKVGEIVGKLQQNDHPNPEMFTEQNRTRREQTMEMKLPHKK